MWGRGICHRNVYLCVCVCNMDGIYISTWIRLKELCSSVKKPDTKDYMLHDAVYMKSSERRNFRDPK